MPTGKAIPKLIVCDVDGTLIDRSEAITTAFDELEQMIKKNRLCFSFASGRCLDQLQKYINTLHITSPVIINNGAGARYGGAVLWDDFLDPMCVRSAIIEANAMDMAIFFCNGNSEVAYRHNAYIQHEIDTFGRYNRFHIPLKNEWPHLKLEKVMITDPQTPGRIDSIVEVLCSFGGELNVIRYDNRHLDVMRSGVNKGGAVRRLASMLNVPLEAVMAIGDGENDIEMLKAVGIGVAVGNAKDELKTHADYVCTQPHTAGVIEAVQKFCTVL